MLKGKIDASVAPNPEIEEAVVVSETTENPVKDATGDDNASEFNNNENENAEILVNGTVKLPKTRVNECKVNIKGITYITSDDKDKAGVFVFQTKEKVWGTVADETGLVEFVKTARSFPASDWGIIPTLRADMLMSRVIDPMLQAAEASKEEFDAEFSHRFDDVELKLVQIYVPAQTEFVNPWSTPAKPKGKAYPRDYVFTFITGFKYNPKNINHKQLLKDIYDGFPYEDEDGTELHKTARFRICPEDFVDSLVDAGYLGKPDEKTVERLYRSIAYKG